MHFSLGQSYYFSEINSNMSNKIFFVDVSNTYSWVSGVTAPPVALETLLQMYVSVEVVSSGCCTKNIGTYNILKTN